MGSSWDFSLTVPGGRAVLRGLIDLAATHGFGVRDGSGQINGFFDLGARHVVLPGEEALIDALAAGEAGQFWTGEVDLFLQGRVDPAAGVVEIGWSLDSCWCFRRPTPEADGFRALHARLVALWLDTAVALGARSGRVDDEWSWEQVYPLLGWDEPWPARAWPRRLGWWTYLGPPAPPPPPAVAAHAARVPGGGTVITLLDDPAAVDVQRYAAIHQEI